MCLWTTKKTFVNLKVKARSARNTNLEIGGFFYSTFRGFCAETRAPLSIVVRKDQII